MQVKDIEIPDNKVLIDVAINQVVLDNGRIVRDPVGSFCIIIYSKCTSNTCR